MANVAPQLHPIPDYDQEPRDTIKPQPWELYVESIAPNLARQTGESVEEARRQLRDVFQPLPHKIMDADAMLRAMDWDDETNDPYSTRPPVTESGVVSKNGASPKEQLFANDNDIPIYVDEEEMQNPAS